MLAMHEHIDRDDIYFSGLTVDQRKSSISPSVSQTFVSRFAASNPIIGLLSFWTTI